MKVARGVGLITVRRWPHHECSRFTEHRTLAVTTDLVNIGRGVPFRR